MKIILVKYLLLTISTLLIANAQEDKSYDTKNYLEFNDRKNTVHGVYLGLTAQNGQVNHRFNADQLGMKIAYVTNRRLELGIAGYAFYSKQYLDYSIPNSDFNEMVGAYGGIHIEPIFLTKKPVNLSFPFLIGSGSVGYINKKIINEEIENPNAKDFDMIFLIEPGVSALVNLSRYLQFEVGMKYRLSTKVNLDYGETKNLNGAQMFAGVKVGVFNMGGKRYKKLAMR